MVKKNILVKNRLVYDDGRCMFYTEDLGILREPFAELMEMQCEEVLERFSTYNEIEFVFMYDEETTIEEFYSCVLNKMGFKKDPRIPRGGWDGTNPLRILAEKMLIGIDDYEHSFVDILNRYHIKDRINTVMLFVCSAGDIWDDDGLRYYMPSKENCRHKSPHVHVKYRHEEEVSIEIKTGNPLAGHMQTKRFKKAKARVLSNQEFLLQCWNDRTDGLRVDINYYLGITPIIKDPFSQFKN